MLTGSRGNCRNLTLLVSAIRIAKMGKIFIGGRTVRGFFDQLRGWMGGDYGLVEKTGLG